MEGWHHTGIIKAYNGTKAIYCKKFRNKKELKEIMEDYKGLEMSILYDEQKGVTDQEQWWNNIKARVL